jgi:hypothetical protein
MTKSTIRRVIVVSSFAACCLAYGWLGFGAYSDREFGGLQLFRKHRLYSRFYFYSPHGESDIPDSTESERRAEHDYTEFVEIHHGRDRCWIGVQ